MSTHTVFKTDTSDYKKNESKKSNEEEDTFYHDLYNHYTKELGKLQQRESDINGINNRTLTKNRQIEISDNLFKKDKNQIDKLIITMIYLGIFIVLLVLLYIEVMPKKIIYILMGLVLIAYILTLLSVNRSLYHLRKRRYGLDTSRFQFKYGDDIKEQREKDDEEDELKKKCNEQEKRIEEKEREAKAAAKARKRS